MSLDQPLEYFKRNREELVSEHHGEFVVIFEETVEGFYSDPVEAYTMAKKKHPEGGFLLKKCLKPEEEHVPLCRSRVA